MFDEAREAVWKSVKAYEPRRVDFFEAWAPTEVRIEGCLLGQS